MLGAEAVTWGVLQGDVFLSCKLSEDSCQLSKLWSSIWLCHWNSVWFRHLWGTPVFCALLVKEEVSKKKEVLTTVQVFVEAWAFTGMPGQCYRFCHLVQPPRDTMLLPHLCSWAGKDLYWMHTPAIVWEDPLFLWVVGDVAKGLPGCLPDLPSVQSRAVMVLMPRTGTMLGMDGKECSEGQSDGEPEGACTWQKEARVYILSLMGFL